MAILAGVLSIALAAAHAAAPRTAARPAPSQRPPPAPAAGIVLARAEAAGVTMAQVGAAIQGTTPHQDLTEVRDRLEAIGLLKENEYKAAEDQPQLVDLVHRLWFDAAPKTAPLFELDESRPVSSIVVRAGDVTYHVHGVVHPASDQLPRLNAAPVRALARGLEKDGHALISERGLPSAFGYSYGSELADDLPRPALQPAFNDPQARMMQGLWTTAKAALVLGPALLVGADPSSALAWAALAAGSGGSYLIHRSFSPLRRASFLYRAARAGGDRGLHLRRWARAVFAPRLDPRELRRAQLPLALEGYRPGAEGHARRSMALAAAAAASGAKQVHVLTGFQHAQEVAGWLMVLSPRS